MIDLRYVKKLIEMLDESSVDSIEISSDKGMKIRISKSAAAARDGADGRANADAADDVGTLLAAPAAPIGAGRRGDEARRRPKLRSRGTSK